MFGKRFEKNRTVILIFSIFVEIEFDERFEIERFARDWIVFEVFDVSDDWLEFENIAGRVAVGMFERLKTETAMIEGQTSEGRVFGLLGRASFFAPVQSSPLRVRQIPAQNYSVVRKKRRRKNISMDLHFVLLMLTFSHFLILLLYRCLRLGVDGTLDETQNKVLPYGIYLTQ